MEYLKKKILDIAKVRMGIFIIISLLNFFFLFDEIKHLKNNIIKTNIGAVYFKLAMTFVFTLLPVKIT